MRAQWRRCYTTLCLIARQTSAGGIVHGAAPGERVGRGCRGEQATSMAGCNHLRYNGIALHAVPRSRRPRAAIHPIPEASVATGTGIDIAN